MENLIVPTTPNEDAYNRIRQFMTEGDITLDAKEELIMRRWIYADKLMLQRKYTTEQMKDKISEMFSVSRHTAQRDIFQAQSLFASVMTVNKKYLLHHHAENILLKMEQFSRDKSLVHLVPKLAQEYTRAVSAIPDHLNQDPVQAPVMIFGVIQNQTVKIAKTYEEALASIQARKQRTEDIDHEEVNDD